MTTKGKMSNLEAFQELSIKIATLEMKLDKILELLNNPDIEVISLGKSIQTDEEFSETYK